MLAISKEKKELIETLGMNIEALLSITPLAARIYALLTLSSQEGLTFDEIKEIIQASKSSISTNLKVLTQLQYIEYYTKSGVRKRYFKVAKYYQLLSLEKEIQSLETRLNILTKINAFNKTHYPEKFINEISLGEILKNYLEQHKQLLEKTIKEINIYKLQDSNF